MREFPALQHNVGEPFARNYARAPSTLAVALMLLGLACTSIAPVSNKQAPNAQAGGDATSKTVSEETEAPDAAAMTAVEAASCDQTDSVRCAARDGVDRLICKDAYWEKHEPCAATERCDATADSPDAQCKALAPECLGRQASTPFCHGTELWVCTSELVSTTVKCPENERCVTRNQVASCDCLLGAERGASGDCLVGTGCPDGACDSKTTCSIVGGERTCSMCPSGYNGDGVTGCAPLLVELTPSCGTLETAISPDSFDYQITAPLICQTVRLTVSAPTGAEVDINGRKLDPELQWTSAPLAFGENTINLTVTDPESGVGNAYRVTINHSGEQTQTVRASNPRAKDFFGTSVAIDGDTLVVGAPFEDGGLASDSTDPADCGGAYVFVREGASWIEQAHLKPEQLVESEFFGASVAIHGDTIVVGATGSDPSDWPSNRERNGAVYVFQRNGDAWSQTNRFTPSAPTGGDFFGNKLALDDDTLLVAAPYDSSVGMESGAIYVFDRAAGGFSETQKVVPSRRGFYTSIGTALALEGDSFVAGGCTDSAAAYDGGVVYVFVRRNGMWQEQQYLPGPGIRDATFGYSIALSGNMLAIGAPRAQRVKAGEADAPLPSGELYLFERDGERWVQTSVLAATVPRQSDRFGSSIVLTPSLLAVSAMGDASAARGLQGDVNDSSAPGSGAVYLYARQSGEPTRTTFVKSQDTAAGIGFGRDMAAAQQTLVVAAPYEAEAKSGAVFVFE